MKQETLQLLEYIQKDEIHGYEIYSRLSKTEKNPKNAKILAKIAQEEMGHYNILKKYTGKDIAPNRLRVWLFYICSRTLGLTFTLKLMEYGELQSEAMYNQIASEIPEVETMLREEEAHELELIDMLKESKLNYMWSVVLGLNDALVELTWALAGFTFAIQNSRTIALIGIITGISASFSMAASEFLSQRQEENQDTKEALISSAYTGFAYIGTVIFLILPYLLISNPFIALAATLTIALTIIAAFNFYISIAKNYNFKKRFFEMACISIGVAIISFGIGWFVKTFLGLDI